MQVVLEASWRVADADADADAELLLMLTELLVFLMLVSNFAFRYTFRSVVECS